MLIHIEKTREPIINIWYFADVKSSFSDNKGYTDDDDDNNNDDADDDEFFLWYGWPTKGV